MSGVHVGYWTGVAFAGFGAAVILLTSPNANAPAVCAIIGGIGAAIILWQFVLAWVFRK